MKTYEGFYQLLKIVGEEKVITKPIKSSVILACLSFSLITGCVSNAPDVEVSTKKYQVNVSEINVLDLSTQNEAIVSMPGYLKMGDNISNPPFSILIYNSLKSALKPSKEKSKDVLDVMLLNANLLITISAADYIPFISIASALSNREQICTVALNLKIGTTNIKKVFENKFSSSAIFTDLDTESKKQLLENCASTIVADVAKYTNEMIDSKK